ncbi:MAG: hypothetical protein ACQEP7_04135 [bacterium]
MLNFFSQLKLDLRLLVLDFEELIFAFICDLLFLIPGYVFYYFFSGGPIDFPALLLCTAVVVNGWLLLPELIFRDLENGWIFQVCVSGLAAPHYYLVKILTGFIGLFSISYMYLLFLYPVFNRDLSWLRGGTLNLFLLVIAVEVVIYFSTVLSADREGFLHLVLGMPLLLPALFAGYVLFSTMGKEFSLDQAWVYWLGSYDLIFLLTGWLVSEYLWEEFNR